MQSQKPPKNCREAFTADGDQVFAGRYYSSENTRPKFLSRDVDSEIRLALFSHCSPLDSVFFNSLPIGILSGKYCDLSKCLVLKVYFT